MLISPGPCQGGFLFLADGVALWLAAAATMSWLVAAISYWLCLWVKEEVTVSLVLQGVFEQHP